MSIDAATRLRTASLIAVTLAGAFVTPAGAAAPDLPRAQAEIVARSNAFRAGEGIAPLAVQARLTAAARQFADFMARTDQYGHEADGRTPEARVLAQGYAWCLVAENIAMQYHSAGFETQELAEGFVQGWIESPGHRRNLLNAAATEIGVAIGHSPRSDRYYAVQVFARPASQKLRFEITNRSPREVRYRLGETRYALPPGAQRRHEQCTADAIELVTPEPSTAPRVRPDDGALYRIEGSGRSLRLVGGATRP